MSGSLLTSRSFLPDLSSLGPSQLLYLFIVGGAVLCSFAFLFRPFVNLGVTIFFLVSANVLILGTSLSAAITTLLIANTLIGIGLASGFKFFVQREALQVPLLVSAIAASGAVYGFFG